MTCWTFAALLLRSIVPADAVPLVEPYGEPGRGAVASAAVTSDRVYCWTTDGHGAGYETWIIVRRGPNEASVVYSRTHGNPEHHRNPKPPRWYWEQARQSFVDGGLDVGELPEP